MMDESKVVGVSNGIELSDEVVERLADEAALGYKVAELKRRGGRRRMGSLPAEVVPVRLDPELRAAVDARASADATTVSDVIREALHRYLEVA
jgi:predicted transcriptional regulator